MDRRKKKHARKRRSKKAEKKPRLDSVRKKANRKPRLDSGRKDIEKKPRLDSDRQENEKETRLGSSRKETGKKPIQDSNNKETDKKIKTERKESKKTNLLLSAGGTKILTSPVETNRSVSARETNKLTRAAEKRMKQLGQDGIIILIDQPNLTIEKEKQMRKEKKERGNNVISNKESWVIRYGRLISVVARGGSGSERRNVLKTCIVTSKKSQGRYGLSEDIQKRYDIEYLVSPVHKRYGNQKEKCVDSMIVRRMVEEYAALDIFRLQGLKVPKRTFCLVSADSDFIDVVKAAREKGFDVELWFFEETGFSDMNWKKADPEECESGKCGHFKKTYLNDYTKKISKWTNLEEDLDWTKLSQSSGKVRRA